ncbi:halocyanin domain-containing protein [Natronomonas marina]|jgi:halocyanin-like protein|uniref:halocyanin domain-containing protein n=1 Tax=Natronomonas marina TaxID=2961939 RepID=UPI0020C9994E|nr:halocyanin domain-containing protein [Natronomonas marina]
MKRRDFMRAAGGTTAAAGATVGAAGPAAAAGGGGEGGGESGGRTVPAFGSYLDDANLYSEESIVDARDQDSVTISVGAGDGLAFDPPAIWISPGTTVTWEWTGEGGTHNVVANEGPAGLDSGSAVESSSATYEFEFTEDHAGITTYRCIPHETSGMKGAVAVGDDVETTTLAGADVKEPIEFGVDIHEHWVGVSVMLLMSVSMVFTFFTLKYGESPHTSGGD